VIEFKDFSFSYEGGNEAVSGVNLRVEAGEFVLLCGPSGGGKSTILRALNGLIPHYFRGKMSGKVIVGGLDTSSHPVHELFSRVGMVFQNPDAQLFAGTVERELAFGLESLGLPRREIAERIAWGAEVLRIKHLLDRSPRSLSGGEKQLVAIGAMLVLKPMVLALDEPFAHLDPMGARRVAEALREVNKLGITVIVVEHRLRCVLPYVTRMIVVAEGKIRLDGPPRQVLREPVEEFGLNLPASVRLSREIGLPEVLLSVEEALPYAKASSPRSPLAPETDGSFPKAIECRELAQVLGGRKALDGVSIEVKKGEILAIVGANGAGKTTLIKHFNGLLKPFAGTVEVLGIDTRKAKVSELATKVGIAFQNPEEQLFTSSVREEILVGPKFLKRMDEGWLGELEELFNLRGLLEKPPLSLSEGEKRRVAFASVLASKPEIIVMDEPTAGQDELFRRRLTELLRALKEKGHTAILVTHDLEFAQSVAEEWAVMAGGRILAKGHPKLIMADKGLMEASSLLPTDSFLLGLT